ncbi:hypothetical protein [Paenibacillus sp. YYML68]|uniref:hypothetical protein n=1 Tax=Paenibacillus sp. YYML68 TaxID=2909250 RepID=UPI00249393E8|nr:hypothetical protein [Paenibacillus sp. YYML68]BDS00568.1 iota-carrageenase CgiB [Paenibacillus sp. YYML68]
MHSLSFKRAWFAFILAITVLFAQLPSFAAAADPATFQGIGNVSYGGKTYFTNKVTTTNKKIVNPGDSLSSIQSKLDSGGVIQFSAGTYNLGTMKITKSNTRVEVHEDATFNMSSNILFDIRPATVSSPRIENIEIASIGPGRFLIKTNGNKGGDKRPVRLTNVKNFAVSGIQIQGNYEGQPFIVLVPYQDGSPGTILVNGVKKYNPIFGLVPTFGVIQDVGATGIHGGYATVQMFGGDNVLMRNIDGENGVTVRLEPGSGQDTDNTSMSGPDLGALRDITLVNVNNKNGFAAVYLKAHAKVNRNITLTNITATNSGSTVHTDVSEFHRGDKVTVTYNGDTYDVERKRGRFENVKLKGNIKLTQTGTSKLAWFAISDLLYIDYSKRNGDGDYADYAPNIDNSKRLTTPIAPVLMLSHEYRSDTSFSIERGTYTMDFSGATIQSVGFSHSLATNGGVLYREDARTKLNKPLTDAQIKDY